MDKRFFSGTNEKLHLRVRLTGLLAVLVLFTSCGAGTEESAPFINPEHISAKDITALSFTSDANPSLTQDVTATIYQTNIYATVPNGTVRTALVASFSATGRTVQVGPAVQMSGSTANNFTAPVTYTVTAQDDSTKNYIVTVSEAAVQTDAVIAGHLAATAFHSIPIAYINAAKTSLRIAYGHTSHGSQLVTGMAALASADNLYAYNGTGDGGALILRDQPFSGASDLGNPNRTAWEAATRTYLNANPTINVIIWSWCGQVDGSQADIQLYLDLMNGLEVSYPNVKFVYMTGHLNGTGAGGNVNQRNEQIRNYCLANNKNLFDFADIESYDPDGSTNFMLQNATDTCAYSGGNWATQWISANSAHELTHLAETCGSCAHSEQLNCVLKGRAVWWLWARLVGWDGNS